LFDFVRSPTHTDHEPLRQVCEFVMQREGNGLTYSVKINEKEWFGLSDPQFMDGVGRKVFKNDTLTAEEEGIILLLHLCETINLGHEYPLLLTENRFLLASREYLKTPCPIIRIINIRECMEIMDLYAKNQGQYFLTPDSSINRGGWYWCQFRSKVPYYNVSTEILAAFASRFICLLKSLDAMGIQYYSGVDNDTKDDTIYHFNYFVSLVTGIFDSLALETRKRLEIRFEGEHIPSRTSLSSDMGREFLRVLRTKNSQLRDHIATNQNFIKMIYAMRELVVHREALPSARLHYGPERGEQNEAIVIKISPKIAERIRECGDKSDPGLARMSKWGVDLVLETLVKDPEYLFLSPYQFAKRATSTLLEFANEYLRLLGFNNFFSTSGAGAIFDDVRRLRNYGLGFLTI